MKIYAISDIHGCLDEFNELLKLCDYQSSNIKIIFTGDASDRGPDSIGVLRRLQELKIQSVSSNHDEKILLWASGKSKKEQPFYKDLKEKDFAYIKQMQRYIKINNTIIVHAGLRGSVPLEKQSEYDLTHIRYLDPEGKIVSLRKINKLGFEQTKAEYWVKSYKLPYEVVHGHHVRSMENVFVDTSPLGVKCYGIDNGCVFGGKLTALCIEDKSVIQVQAKEVYCKPLYAPQ